MSGWSWPVSIAVACAVFAIVLLDKIWKCLNGILLELAAIRNAINGPSSVAVQLEEFASDIRVIKEGVEDIRLSARGIEGHDAIVMPTVDEFISDITNVRRGMLASLTVSHLAGSHLRGMP